MMVYLCIESIANIEITVFSLFLKLREKELMLKNIYMKKTKYAEKGSLFIIQS